MEPHYAAPAAPRRLSDPGLRRRPPPSVLGALLRGPFSRSAWRDAAFVAAGSLVLAPVFAVSAAGGPWFFTETFLPLLLVLVIAAAAVLPWTLNVANRVQRSRFRGLLGIGLDTEPLFPGPASWRGLYRARRSATVWRAVLYHLVLAPIFAIAGIFTTLLWPGALGALLLSLSAKSMPTGSPLRSGGSAKELAMIFGLGGLAALWATPALNRIVAGLDESAAVLLLGPDRQRVLEERVVGLTESRSALVAAVDAERRRIERDLHDGTQQRLVSLAIKLGLARATLTGTSPQVDAVLAEAHEEAKATLAELRDLVRGLHPAVLDDRGLDAALSGIAARAPLSVSLSVDLPRRASPSVEAVAYFVVSEALANVAKHAKATEAGVDVRIDAARGRLCVRITDDGVGGADPRLGSGLAGLARRAASVDGTFQLSSPPGGPTVITVELPCVP